MILKQATGTAERLAETARAAMGGEAPIEDEEGKQP